MVGLLLLRTQMTFGLMAWLHLYATTFQKAQALPVVFLGKVKLVYQEVRFEKVLKLVWVLDWDMLISLPRV
jgi:hypothetical protein